MRLVIIDTNVLISGLLTREATSPTAEIVNGMLSGGIAFLLSPALLAEYRAVCTRPKIQKVHGMSEADVDSVLTEITANAIWREPQVVLEAPDPGDNHLWTLLDTEPEATLITGDQLLLNNPPSNRRVINPIDWIRELM